MRKLILVFSLVLMSNVFGQQPVIQLKKPIKIKSTLTETLSYSVLGEDTTYYLTYKNCEYQHISDFRTISLTYNELIQMFNLCETVKNDEILITPKYSISKEYGSPLIKFGENNYTYLLNVKSLKDKLQEHKDPNNPVYKKGKLMPLVVIPLFVLLVIIVV